MAFHHCLVVLGSRVHGGGGGMRLDISAKLPSTDFPRATAWLFLEVGWGLHGGGGLDVSAKSPQCCMEFGVCPALDKIESGPQCPFLGKVDPEQHLVSWTLTHILFPFSASNQPAPAPPPLGTTTSAPFHDTKRSEHDLALSSFFHIFATN